MGDPAVLRKRLGEEGRGLWTDLSGLAERWCGPIIPRLLTRRPDSQFPKTVNDPVWGVIQLYPWETAILDSPLVQRLRGVRQLGMAYYVYPGAVHDRLEHSLGVVEAADRMIRALVRNAGHRRRFGTDVDETIPVPDELDDDIVSTRLAALLHDVGHGPFSHATEFLLRDRYADEFRRIEAVLRQEFEGVSRVAPSEIIAVLIVLCDAMREVLVHPNFGASKRPEGLAPAIAARILGSRSYLRATYLSGIVSGPLDADKLDYMARDSHHSGLPLGLDLDRLISKLEVVTVTPENAPNPELRKRAEQAPNRRFYDIGISLTGLGAYEQMIVGRVILYDRIYYHHKVRSAEAMIRRLIALAEKENGRQFSLSELFHDSSDDSVIGILSGRIGSDGLASGGDGSRRMGHAIHQREIYGRAFALAARFIGGLDGLPQAEQRDTRALLWTPVLKALSDDASRVALEESIYEKAQEVARFVPDLQQIAAGLRPEHVLVDLPLNKVVARGGDILTRTQEGHVGTPNLFFDPEKWSQAYEHQKQCGFVFAPRDAIPLVSLASRIVFYDRFQIAMTAAAEHAAKCLGVVQAVWFEQAAAAGACSAECLAALREERPSLVPIREEDILLPDEWRTADQTLARRLAEGFQEAVPAGFPASVHRAIRDAIPNLISFMDMTEQGGTFVGLPKLSERELQSRLRDHLRSRSVRTLEGSEVGGGETDLVLPGELVIENKATEDVADPLNYGPNYAWQGRRYSIAVCRKVVFVVLGYRPSNEAAIRPLPSRIAVRPIGSGPDAHAQVRIVVPWGHPVPSRVKAP